MTFLHQFLIPESLGSLVLLCVIFLLRHITLVVHQRKDAQIIANLIVVALSVSTKKPLDKLKVSSQRNLVTAAITHSHVKAISSVGLNLHSLATPSATFVKILATRLHSVLYGRKLSFKTKLWIYSPPVMIQWNGT